LDQGLERLLGQVHDVGGLRARLLVCVVLRCWAGCVKHAMQNC